MLRTLPSICAVLLAGLFVAKQPMTSAGDPAPKGRVQGKITFEGKPVKIGSVVAISDDFKQSAFGMVKEDGTYLIKAAPVGKVRLTYTPPAFIDPSLDPFKDAKPKKKPESDGKISKEMEEHIKELQKVPDRYRSPAKTVLKTVVEAGKDTTYEIRMVKKEEN
jgi:hypothetical protein